MVADSYGLPIGFELSAGQVYDCINSPTIDRGS